MFPVTCHPFYLEKYVLLRAIGVLSMEVEISW